MIRYAWGLLLAVAGLAALGPATAAAQVPPVGASAQLHDAGGRLLATATFRQASDEVLINLVFPDRGALTGTHGIQIHEVGRCDPPDFSSAGGIFNPTRKQHGLLNPDGPMAGDVPSLVIGPIGVSGYNTTAPLVTLSPGPASLLKQGGTSLIIFAQPDDDLTQPDGQVGARIACGVIVAGAAGATSTASSTLPEQTDPSRTVSLVIAAMGLLLLGAGVVLRRQPRH